MNTIEPRPLPFFLSKCFLQSLSCGMHDGLGPLARELLHLLQFSALLRVLDLRRDGLASNVALKVQQLLANVVVSVRCGSIVAGACLGL
jgi:hypothetical protein